MAVSGWSTYQLRRQLVAIGEDFWVQNARGQNVYKLDGKVLTLKLMLCVAIAIDEMSEPDRH